LNYGVVALPDVPPRWGSILDGALTHRSGTRLRLCASSVGYPVVAPDGAQLLAARAFSNPFEGYFVLRVISFESPAL
jgi:hypothetical protein